MKAVIIDDEKQSRELLRTLIDSYCPELSICGVAGSVEEGFNLINTCNPAIVFLDIEMQSSTGFDLLQKLDSINFDVVFTTAYEHYALKAIEFSALAYILKPIDISDLRAVIHKTIQKENKYGRNRRIDQLLSNLYKERPSKITIATLEDVLFVEISDIIRCEAKGAYTELYLKDATKITASKNLKEFESLLSDHGFFRVHNSHLVNLESVKRYIRSDSGYIEMKDGKQIPIANHRKQDFFDYMNRTNI